LTGKRGKLFNFFQLFCCEGFTVPGIFRGNILKEFYLTLKSDPDISLRAASFKNKKGRSDAQTIIIIPGFFGSIEERSILAAHLTDEYNVVIYEPRGFGKSTKKRKKGIYYPENFGRELQEVIELLELKDNEFIVFGSSLAVAFIHHFALLDQSKAAALVLVSPAPYYRGSAVLRALRFTPYWLQTLIRMAIFGWLRLSRSKEEADNFAYAEKRFKELDPWVQFRVGVEGIGFTNLRGREKDIPGPVCVFSARKDDITSPEDAAKYTHNEKSELILVDSNAHKFINGREEFIARRMKEFLSKISSVKESDWQAGS